MAVNPVWWSFNPDTSTAPMFGILRSGIGREMIEHGTLLTSIITSFTCQTSALTGWG